MTESNIMKPEPMPDYLASEAHGGGHLYTLIEKSPKHYRHRLKFPKTSAAFSLGTLAHTAILEPEEWASGYVRGPDGDGRTKAVRDALKALKEEHADKQVVKADDFDRVEGMAASVEESDANPLGLVEHSVYWTGHADLRLKCRPDNLHERTHYSLKTTRDAHPRTFARDALRLGYIHSLGHYHNGLLAATGIAHRHVIIAVESDPPYAVGVFDVDRDAVAYGAAEMDRAARLLAGLQNGGTWPGYPRVALAYEWMQRTVGGVGA